MGWWGVGLLKGANTGGAKHKERKQDFRAKKKQRFWFWIKEKSKKESKSVVE